MKLLTEEIRKSLPPLRSTEGQGDDAVVRAKFFHPASRYTLFVTEFDGEDTLYGWCVSPLGADCDEWGYTSLAELASLRVLGLGVERDLYFEPRPLREALEREAARS